ncbi:MAG: hypothetical protein JWP87_5119 [Labilithrix sp.]|nr:hypothetical protein [Labilithrix sp.]
MPAIAIAGLGCSLASLDDLSSGDPAQPGGPDANVGSDAIGSPPGDGGAEAEAAPFSCAALSPKPIVCTQFDDPALVTGWDDLRVSTGAEATLDTMLAVTRPSSLRVTVANATQDPQTAYLIRNVATKPTKQISASFDVRFTALDAAQLTYAQLSVTTYYLNMVVSASQTFMQQAIPNPDNTYTFTNVPMGVSLRAGQWQRIAVSVDLDAAGDGGASASFLTVTVDGVKAIDRAPVEAYRFVGAGYFVLGTYFRTTPTAAWTTWYDDAIFDWK